MTFRICYRFFFLALFLSGCSEKAPTLFELIPSEQSGITFQNTITSTPELNILNYIYFYNGAGVATADFNNDGFIDIYFSGNQIPDALYINEGGLKFKDFSIPAGILNDSGWTNGVSIVDINNDGYLDIYLCKVGNYRSIEGKNLLYVNQGPNDLGIPHFKEAAADYQLDFSGFSTQASFFDYDNDGDLDLFLLNHSTNPNQNYGKGSNRFIPNRESGDKLFENQNGLFVDVSEKAGIFQSKFGYGLGVSMSDLNNDGFPDIYVSNDFFENDYLYLNNGDKTFIEVIHQSDSVIGHTTHYSMGNDIHDINNDGYPDIVSLDMLPEDTKTYKTSGTEFNYQIYQNYIRNGYAHQYMQNALQLNNGNGTFSETGYLSGIAATEWSWSPLIADFDNDGLNDLYISNGILGATNDMDFINFIANETIQKALGQGMTEKEMAFIEKIPAKKTPNYFFKNLGDNRFEDVTQSWFERLPSYSNGSAYADLDNDGDLDLVVNNVNQEAFLLENHSDSFYPEHHFLKIRLQGPHTNPFGIGAQVIVYNGNKKHIKENYPTKGFLSSSAPELTFGLGNATMVDSIEIRWPDGKQEVLTSQNTNETLVALYTNALLQDTAEQINTASFYTNVGLPINYQHKENSNIEFNRDPLLPFALGNEGPAVAVGDVNNDGLEDVFFGGGKGQSAQLFLQEIEGGFTSSQQELFLSNALAEDTDAQFVDLNKDGYLDLVVVCGGNELTTGENASPRLYWNRNGNYEKDEEAFVGIFMNASKVSVADWDSDGLPDLAFLANTIAQEFGKNPEHHFFKNKGDETFVDVTMDVFNGAPSLGQINDLQWSDLNGDGSLDFVAAGDWTPIQIYYQGDGVFEKASQNGLDFTHGWWNTLVLSDMDGDGDLDILAGNWGLNSRMKAGREEPIRLYKNDFDNNGSEETLITYYYKGIETTLSSKEELAKQMPMINKKYLSFEEFANARITEIFSTEKLKQSLRKEVYELGSCFFENLGKGTFKKHLLPFEAQISTINAIAINHFSTRETMEALIIGNNYELSTQLGRLDAQHGTLLRFQEGNIEVIKGILPPLSGAGRKILPISYRGETVWMIVRNNDKPLFIKRNTLEYNE